MNIKIKLSVIIKLFLFYLFIGPSFGEISLESSKIETYLNSIKTLEADLIQISSNGEVQTGELFLKKPGQMRFEYDGPSNHLVIASGFLLVIIDKKSSSEPQRYLTSQTPIGFLISEDIKFTKESNFKTIFLEDSLVNLVLYNQNKPNIGELQLKFSKDPIALKEWTLTNYSGEKTRILLENVVINEPIDIKLFDIGQEISNSKKQLNQN